MHRALEELVRLWLAPTTSSLAYAEQEPEGIPLSEHAARGPIDRDLPRHQIGAWWMIVEGWGNNRGKG